MTFKEALRSSFEEYGVGLLRNPERFRYQMMGAMGDDAESSSRHAPLVAQCDRELLSPFVIACRRKTPEAIELAVVTASSILVVREAASTEEATSFARELGEAISEFLRIASVPGRSPGRRRANHMIEVNAEAPVPGAQDQAAPMADAGPVPPDEPMPGDPSQPLPTPVAVSESDPGEGLAAHADDAWESGTAIGGTDDQELEVESAPVQEIAEDVPMAAGVEAALDDAFETEPGQPPETPAAVEPDPDAEATDESVLELAEDEADMPELDDEYGLFHLGDSIEGDRELLPEGIAGIIEPVSMTRIPQDPLMRGRHFTGEAGTGEERIAHYAQRRTTAVPLMVAIVVAGLSAAAAIWLWLGRDLMASGPAQMVEESVVSAAAATEGSSSATASSSSEGSTSSAAGEDDDADGSTTKLTRLAQEDYEGPSLDDLSQSTFCRDWVGTYEGFSTESGTRTAKRSVQLHFDGVTADGKLSGTCRVGVGSTQNNTDSGSCSYRVEGTIDWDTGDFEVAGTTWIDQRDFRSMRDFVGKLSMVTESITGTSSELEGDSEGSFSIKASW